MKLSDDDKREIIRLNKEAGVSQAKLARMYNVDVSIIERLIRKYGVYGEAALIRKPYRKYSPEFKMEIINRCRNGESKGSLAIANNIRPSMIRSWLKRYEKDGYNGLIDKKKGRPPKMKKEDGAVNETVNKDNGEIKPESADKARIRVLEKKNKELEAEVAYLKKLNALVQERKKRESKKK
ncbi:MAG: helix-turn-helix domain-containing protein [Erysipelotrichaceae bacterium]|nr:helix-turn-helix domain-containing protein [Erysipelotrichaceae bacterium]